MILPRTIAEAGRALRDGSLDVVTLTDAYLSCIRALQPKLNAFITVTDAQARATAEHLDKDLRAGRDRGPLHGIPVVYKDDVDTAGVTTTMGSAYFSDRVPNQDATVVQKLRTAGTVMLGKTNMNELAAGGKGGFNQCYGDTRNPWSLEREPGGSSSGSAAAVAAGLCLGAVGTDAGGSVRGPASRCGVAGIRPTYGRVSTAGIFPRAPSYESTGPIARTVEDLVLMLTAMAGYDPRDPNARDLPDVDFGTDLTGGISGMRLGVIENYSRHDLERDVCDAFQDAVATFADLGAEVKSVKFPLLRKLVDSRCLTDIIFYEFNRTLGDRYRATDPDLFGPIVHADFEKARAITDADYQDALSQRTAHAAAAKQLFDHVDAFLTPTMATTAPRLSAPMDFSGRHRVFTLPFSYFGLPAVSIPCGFSRQDTPIGLQIVGDGFAEARILKIAAAFERATAYHERRPPIACDTSA